MGKTDEKLDAGVKLAKNAVERKLNDYCYGCGCARYEVCSPGCPVVIILGTAAGVPFGRTLHYYECDHTVLESQVIDGVKEERHKHNCAKCGGHN